MKPMTTLLALIGLAVPAFAEDKGTTSKYTTSADFGVWEVA